MTTLIIGAGLSGLTAAHQLQQNGHSVTLLDKGRGVGGRLATRRLGRDAEASRADHGAQYFSARSPELQALVHNWQAQGLVQEWHIEQSDPASFQHPRYAVTGGMSQLAKQLAQGLDVRTGERATYLTQTDTGWQVRCDSGLTLSADALLLTLPAPQAIALLNESGVTLAEADQQALTSIHYEPCLAVMLRLNQPSQLPKPGGLKLPDGPVSWLADNQQKGVSEQPTVTIHASHAYSQQHLDDADLTALIPELLAAVSDYVPADRIVESQMHRWRYSNATKRHPDPMLAATLPGSGTLLFGGDGFGNGNVEGAFLSGLAMARHVTGQRAA
ncbi:NAD(P)/FAD-dependent oxidoreductase [Fibrella aestuarina]|uniref:NAD(P)/FAD-dependent oxidoreductase n=1 Tax=Fibrella aestuarina TaxID=651143 RepID=UPI00059BE899|nr:FAD-dependent oxidoreductase [Fibrella aestuarina]